MTRAITATQLARAAATLFGLIVGVTLGITATAAMTRHIAAALDAEQAARPTPAHQVQK